jgi:hypothetical protein
MQLTDLPRQSDLAEYERAIDVFIDHFKRLGFVKSILQFGSIGSPGISDVDFLVILKDEAEIGKLLSAQFDKLRATPEGYFVAYHPPFFASAENVSDLHYLRSFGKCQHLWGDKVKIEELQMSEDEIAVMLLEFAFIYYPVLLASEKFYDKYRVRYILQAANAVKFLVPYYEKLSLVDFAWRNKVDNYLSMVAEARNGWFDLSQPEQQESLKEIVSQWFAISEMLKESLASFFEKSVGSSDNISNLGTQHIRPSFPCYFLADYGSVNERELMSRFFDRYRMICYFYPLIFYPMVAQGLRECFNFRVPRSQEVERMIASGIASAISQRTGRQIKVLEFFKRTGIPYEPLYSFWAYRKPAGVKSRAYACMQKAIMYFVKRDLGRLQKNR